MRCFHRFMVCVLVGSAFLAACTPSGGSPRASSDQVVFSGSPVAGPIDAPPAGGDKAGPGGERQNPPKATPTGPGSPSPFAPDEYPAQFEASLLTDCVNRGGEMTLRVHLPKPKSAAGYLAYYADGKTGAPEPWGKGYGGNASGISDDAGNWASTWMVALEAPIGPGRVDVHVAVPGIGKGFKSLPFTVANVGDC